MSIHIGNKINDIFSEELNLNRNIKLFKKSTSNKLNKNKYIEDKDKNYEIIRQFNKRQSKQEDSYFKDNIKFVNENNDNDISIKKGKKKENKDENNIKQINKKPSKFAIKDYLDEDNDIFIDRKDLERVKIKSFHQKNNKDVESCFRGILNKDSKKIKKTKFLIGEKKPEENKNYQNNSKKKKINTKRTMKNIVMVEKQKYPKKETIFDRIKGSIKESNKEISNDNDSQLKKGIKKNTYLKSKKFLNNSIKMFDTNFKMRETTRTKKPGINIVKNSENKVYVEKDSSDFIKLNLDLLNNNSIYSNSKTMKTLKTEKSKNTGKKLKVDNNKNSENDFFQSSKFSNSDSKEESKYSPNNKDDIFFNKNSKKINNNNNIMESSKGLKIVKNPSRKIINKKSNNLNVYDNKSIKKSQNSSFIDSSSSDSDEHSNDGSKKQKNSKLDNSINKKFQFKYTHGEGVLSIIPEQDNKKVFYEDINQNLELIKPENIITLEQNIKRDKNISRNLEIKKNNIIINNNVSNNITVHKKGSDSKNEEIKKEEETNKENNLSKKKGKPYKIKVRKKFPFCCL